jgi:hypothetical protein
LRCELLARKICFHLENNPLDEITRFMPLYTLTSLYDIMYGLLKYRNLNLDGDYPSVKMFHFNNLLTKDKLDNDTDPFPIKILGQKTKG